MKFELLGGLIEVIFWSMTQLGYGESSKLMYSVMLHNTLLRVACRGCLMPILSRWQVGFFAAFKGLIEKAVQQNDNSPAVIAAHSMGCLVTAYFLNRQSAEWQAAHIARIIVMSAPF